MKKILFITSICLAAYSNHASAQSVTKTPNGNVTGVSSLTQVGINGAPVMDSEYVEVDGNPYLFSDWVSGSVNLQDNKSLTATLKFDICNNHLLFQSKDGTALELKNDARSFVLNTGDKALSDISPLVFVNGYPPVGQRTESSWFQLIADGKTRLLKYYKKQIKEEKQFTSATTTKSFISMKYYYIFKNNQLIEVSPSKKEIFKVLNDHSSELETYAKTNNINFKSDIDLAKLFAYYNSLG
jgi:hypothetical protein